MEDSTNPGQQDRITSDAKSPRNEVLLSANQPRATVLSEHNASPDRRSIVSRASKSGTQNMEEELLKNSLRMTHTLHDMLRIMERTQQEEVVGRPEHRFAVRVFIQAVALLSVVSFSVFAALSWIAAETQNSKAQTANLLAIMQLCSQLPQSNAVVDPGMFEICGEFWNKDFAPLRATLRHVVSDTAQSWPKTYSGFSEPDKIAIGVCLSAILPAIIAAVLVLFYRERKRKIMMNFFKRQAREAQAALELQALERGREGVVTQADRA